VLASATGTVAKGIVLLTAYSLGLAGAFLLVGAAFARAMGSFRFLRDNWMKLRVVSGFVLVALGLLLYFHREWWLYVGLRRVLDAFGLGEL